MLEREAYQLAARLVKLEYLPRQPYRLDDHVQITADAPRAIGTWSIPDIIGLCRVSLPLVGARLTEVHTFEVKRSADLSLASVYEADAQGRSAHCATLLVHTGSTREEPKRHAETLAACKAFGLGYWWFWGETSRDHEACLDPVRRAPDLMKVERMLDCVLGGQRESIESWARSPGSTNGGS